MAFGIDKECGFHWNEEFHSGVDADQIAECIDDGPTAVAGLERDIEFEFPVGDETTFRRDGGSEFSRKGAQAGGDAAVDYRGADREPAVGVSPAVVVRCLGADVKQGEVSLF